MTPLQIVLATVVLSVCAVVYAHWETEQGISKDPLKNDPRHRQHRREQRHRSRIQRPNSRPTHHDTITEVATLVRDATDPRDRRDTEVDHAAIARTIYPHSLRVRRVCRSTVLSESERHYLWQFHQLIHRYAYRSASATDPTLDALADDLHDVATAITRQYAHPEPDEDSSRSAPTPSSFVKDRGISR